MISLDKNLLKSAKNLFDSRSTLISNLEKYKHTEQYSQLLQESMSTEDYETQKDKEIIKDRLNQNYTCLISIPSKISTLKTTSKKIEEDEIFQTISNCSISIYLKLPQINNNLLIKNNITIQITQEESKEGNYSYIKVLEGYARFFEEEEIYLDYFKNNPHINEIKSGELQTLLTIPFDQISLTDFFDKMNIFTKNHIKTCYKNDFFQAGFWQQITKNNALMKEILDNADYIKDNFQQSLKLYKESGVIETPKHLKPLRFGMIETDWEHYYKDYNQTLLFLELNRNLEYSYKTEKRNKV